MSDHLLSLELQGYKTFAHKTEFRFPAQLTAIVGPNGSGKSNIADAIRWVLGEQAYSLLRGKKTVDMIFSGSKQRPRASMASVSITFDNQSGWLPIEYSEVNISRRAYRNGENEYLINNKRVRLKEINELLANSGLAERNYTVIGQGLVDSALSLRPEDRRSFFEEAAGIGLYRSRRVEAIQKLDKTQRNNERINDILIELEPRIRSLEKQQEKTKTYIQIDADLKLLLNDWYGYHWHTTQKNLEAAVAFNAQQQVKLDKSRELRQGLEKKLKESQDSLQEKRGKLSELHLQLSKLHVEKEENLRQLAVLEEREKAQYTRILEIENTISIAKDKKSDLEEKIVELNDQSKADQLEFQTIEESLESAKGLLQKRIEQRSEINTSIYNRENELNKDQHELLRLMTLVAGLKHQINLQSSDAEKIKINTEETQKDYKQAGIELEKLRAQRKILAQEIKTIDDEKFLLKEILDAAVNEIGELYQRKQKNEQVLIRLKSDFNLLVEAEEAMAGFSSGAKSIFEAVREGKLTGKFSLLMDHLDIPKEYEIAIAAVLGAAIEGIVVKSDSDTESALDFIEATKAPRTILVVNKKPAYEFIKGIIQGKHIVASELVSANERFEPFINNLLSSSLIVDDRKVAADLASKLPLGYRVVTKNGEVYASDQTITAGKESRVRSFTRKREKQALTAEIDNTKNVFTQITESLEEGENNKKEIQQRLEEFINKRNNAEKEINRLSLEVHKLEIEQDQRQKQLENENDRLEELLISIKGEESNISELEKKTVGLGEIIEEQKEETEKFYNDLKTLPVEELRSTVTSLTSKYAVAEQIAENGNKRIQEKEDLLSSNQKAIDQNKIRRIELEDQLGRIGKEIKKIKDSNGETSEKINTQTADTNVIEEIVENEITNQGKFLEEVDDSRRKFAVAERHKLQSQMRVEKMRDKIEGYQKKISGDFGILMEGEESSTYGPKPLPFSGIVASLPRIDNLPENLADQISQQRAQLRRLGPINPNAQEEYEQENNRYQFLSEQLQDLEKAEKDLRIVVDELDEMMKKEFLKTFNKVEIEFENIFKQLFNGGEAKLIIEDEENILDSGIDIEATLPGRRKQELALLSGGERSLTAVALIFSLLKISPTPFCVLDEIDAMLDEANIMRVGELLKELSDTTQFIIITHNRNTVQLADILYGVTMGKDSVSQVISLKLDELTEEMVQ
jgi:chromosome segregation protein